MARIYTIQYIAKELGMDKPKLTRMIRDGKFDLVTAYKNRKTRRYKYEFDPLKTIEYLKKYKEAYNGLKRE